MKRYLPIIESVTKALAAKVEQRLFYKSERVSAFYKDMWELRTVMKWKGKVRFVKKDDGLEIFVFADMAAEVLAPESTEDIYIIPDGLTIFELAQELLDNKDKPRISLKMKHLPKEDQARLVNAFNNLHFDYIVKKDRVILTKRQQ